jgi:hypothetical protein
VDAISVSSQKFEQDMVHLTEDAGWIFVAGILGAAEAFFRGELVDLEGEEKEDETMQEDVEPKPSGIKVYIQNSSSVKKHSRASLSKAVEKLVGQDNKSLERKTTSLKLCHCKKKR